MAISTQSRHRIRKQHIEKTAAQEICSVEQRELLWIELTAQRAQILEQTQAPLRPDAEPEACPDPADQASTELEQDLAIQVRKRTFDRLRRIEHALQLIRTNGYGLCLRCRTEIPYERLRVQPDALFCVPCLTLVERGAAQN
jgi:RNA polymerase-binding protein DksA